MLTKSTNRSETLNTIVIKQTMQVYPFGNIPTQLI